MIVCLDPRTSVDWRNVGNDKGGTRYAPLTQIDRRNVKDLEVAWTYRSGDGTSGSTIECTPVVAEGVIYGLSTRKRGQVVAVDAATGTVKWATEGRAADQAAILLTPAHVLLLTTGGELVLVKRSPAKYEEERRYTVADSATWAVPVVMKDALVVRDKTIDNR